MILTRATVRVRLTFRRLLTSGRKDLTTTSPKTLLGAPKYLQQYPETILRNHGTRNPMDDNFPGLLKQQIGYTCYTSSGVLTVL